MGSTEESRWEVVQVTKRELENQKWVSCMHAPAWLGAVNLGRQ